MARPPAPPTFWKKTAADTIAPIDGVTKITWTDQGKLVVLTKATSGSLTAQECTGTQINNLGQSGNVVINLPTCAEGLSFEVLLSTTAAFYYRLAPAATDKIYLDGVALADGYYVGVANANVGSRIHFEAGLTGTDSWDWHAATGPGNWQAQAA